MKIEQSGIGLLADKELDAIAGGMINNGQGQYQTRAPGAYVPYGPQGSDFSFNKVMDGLITVGLAVGAVYGITAP